MGACYSNNPAEVEAKYDSKFRPRKKDSKRDKKRQKEIILCEQKKECIIVPQQEVCAVSQKLNQNSDLNLHHQQSLSSAFSRDEDNLSVQNILDVAPSDSGFESLGVVSDEKLVSEVVIREKSDSERERNRLSRRLERLSRGSCHRCGNFKLDDSALTALLSDTYCLCGPRQAGKPAINPACQTHGSHKKSRSALHSLPDVSNNKEQAKPKSSVMFSGIDTSIDCSEASDRRLSLCSTESLELALASLVRSGSSSSCEEAPLAPGETSSLPRRHPKYAGLSASSRSLLTEILDITESVCRCDFYSNEYCSIQHGDELQTSMQQQNQDLSDKENNLKNGFSGDSEESEEFIINNSMKPTSLKPTSLFKNGLTDCTNTDSPHQKYASLPRFLSTVSPSVISQSCTSSPSKMSLKTPDSGVVSPHSASESFLFKVNKESPKRPVSLGSRGMLMSETSSEEEEESGTCEDLGSVDMLDTLSVTSLRQRTDSHDKLHSPLLPRRLVYEGEECVVIPTDTYSQMQLDLEALKNQLGALSQLIFEEQKERSFEDAE